MYHLGNLPDNLSLEKKDLLKRVFLKFPNYRFSNKNIGVQRLAKLAYGKRTFSEEWGEKDSTNPAMIDLTVDEGNDATIEYNNPEGDIKSNFDKDLFLPVVDQSGLPAIELTGRCRGLTRPTGCCFDSPVPTLSAFLKAIEGIDISSDNSWKKWSTAEIQQALIVSSSFIFINERGESCKDRSRYSSFLHNISTLIQSTPDLHYWLTGRHLVV